MRNSGQTLIETIVAIFILTTAITGGLALTLYVYSNANRGFQEIVATNLAREAIDVVRNMRDTNWLESDDKGVAPWTLQDCSIGPDVFQCYPRTWKGVSGGSYHDYNLDTPGVYQLSYNNGTNSWSLNSTSFTYGLYLQPDGSYTNTVVSATPNFTRKIILSHNTNAPFSSVDPNSLSELIITSIVGWSGKGCNPMTGEDPATTNCNVIISEHLTNWKDYE